MAEKKLRVVHYLNQFFGQVGGEEKATTGFMVKQGPVGPGLALQKELGDKAEIVATVICGDDYFAGNPDQNAEEGLKLITSYQPDLFFAGPAFAAGRYSVACGAMCKAVGAELGIPVISGMHEEVPGMELYRKYAFICKTGNNARLMPEAIRNMVRLAFRLISGEKEMGLLTRENLPKPEEYNYFSRNLLRNEYCEKSIAERSVEKLVAKLQGKPFESEVVPPRFERVIPPTPIKDLSKCEIALISDGGLVPKGNPDGLARRSNLKWGAYDIEALFREYEVTHAGYFNDHVLARPDRLVPADVMRDLVKEGKIGKLHRTFFSTSGCTTVSKRCGEMGEEMGAVMKKGGIVGAAILTSTWGSSTRCGATIASSIEKLGIPVVQITAIPNIAQMLGVNRIVQGRAVTNPVGDPTLTKEQEKELRRKYVFKALELLQKDVEGPTVVTLEGD